MTTAAMMNDPAAVRREMLADLTAGDDRTLQAIDALRADDRLRPEVAQADALRLLDGREETARMEVDDAVRLRTLDVESEQRRLTEAEDAAAWAFWRFPETFLDDRRQAQRIELQTTKTAVGAHWAQVLTLFSERPGEVVKRIGSLLAEAKRGKLEARAGAAFLADLGFSMLPASTRQAIAPTERELREWLNSEHESADVLARRASLTAAQHRLQQAETVRGLLPQLALNRRTRAKVGAGGSQ